MTSAPIQIKKPQNSLLRPFIAFLKRFHLLLFFVFIVTCLALAIILISKTLSDSPEDPYTPSVKTGTVDEATLKRIQTLHQSSQPSTQPELPTGRVNPFSE